MMKDEWKTALCEAFDAPEPANKQAFLKGLRIREVSTAEMLIQQVRYIRISVWILAGAIIALTLLGSWMRLDETGVLLAEIIPYLAAVSMLENIRSRRYGMTELEMVTRFSLRSVIFARMLILGLVFLFILVITSPVIAVCLGGGIVLNAMLILIPYLITMSVSLRVERSVWGRRTEYAPLVIATIVSGSLILIKSYQAALVLRYMAFIQTWGLLLVLILTAMTVFEQWKTINSVEAYA